MRYKQIVDMARQARAWPELSETPVKDVAFLKRFAELVFEQGKQEGMKQECALWELSRVGQEIEAQLVQAQERPWVGLTDAEAQWMYDNCRTPAGMMDMVEAKLKEKNS
jgi:hypothetical protein